MLCHIAFKKNIKINKKNIDANYESLRKFPHTEPHCLKGR